MTVFDEITKDHYTLAANMVQLAHRSIIEWAARRGIRVEFSIEEFLRDCTRITTQLEQNAEAVSCSVLQFAAVQTNPLKPTQRGASDKNNRKE